MENPVRHTANRRTLVAIWKIKLKSKDLGGVHTAYHDREGLHQQLEIQQ